MANSSSVAGRVNPRTMVRWRVGAARASIGSCKTKPQRHRQPRRSGVPRSRGCRRSLREAVDAAIADGATIDEIADLIRGEGGACSRSAVGRYTKNVRDLILRQQETDRANEMWVRALGERTGGPCRAHPDRDPADDDALHHGRTQRARGARVDGRALPSLRSFSSASKAPTSSDLQREQAAAKAAARAAAGAGQAPGQAPVRKGLSPETVDAHPTRPSSGGFDFRPRPAGHIGAGRPVESCGIPLNPT